MASCRTDDMHQQVTHEGNVLTIQDVKELVSTDPKEKNRLFIGQKQTKNLSKELIKKLLQNLEHQNLLKA